MKSLFTVDFAADTIYASKTTLKKAGIPNSPEYKELMKLKKKHPALTIAEKEIKKAEGKNTHKGLDKAFIEKYISIQSNAADLKAQYEQAAKMGKFPLVRKWFLHTFMNFNMETAKEEIAKALLAEIAAVAATAEKKVVAMPEQKIA